MQESTNRPAMSIKEQLVPIINRDNGDFVNARDLHKFIKSKQDFSNWIKGRINKYQFKEGIDYFKILETEKSKEVNDKFMVNSPKNDEVNNKFIENPTQKDEVNHKFMENPTQKDEVNDKFIKNLGGRPEIEYEITLDMAKELSMIENTAKGRDVRQYFIAAEKALRNNSTVQVVHIINEYEAEIERLESDRSAINAKLKQLRAAQKDVIKNPYKQIGMIPFPNKKEVSNG